MNRTLLPALAALSTIAFAQQEGNLYHVTRVTIKADHMETYRDYLKKMSDGYRKAGVESYSVYSALAGNPLELMIVRSVKNYAQLDDGNLLKNVYTPEQRSAFNLQRNQCTEAVTVTYERSVVALGGGDPRAYRTLRRFRVRQEMTQAYTSALQTDLLPQLSKAEGVRYRVRRVEWGGAANDFVSTFDTDKLASLDAANPIRQALGEAKANAWFQKVAAHGTNVEALIYRFEPDLSWRQPATTTSR